MAPGSNAGFRMLADAKLKETVAPEARQRSRQYPSFRLSKTAMLPAAARRVLLPLRAARAVLRQAHPARGRPASSRLGQSTDYIRSRAATMLISLMVTSS